MKKYYSEAEVEELRHADMRTIRRVYVLSSVMILIAWIVGFLEGWLLIP